MPSIDLPSPGPSSAPLRAAKKDERASRGAPSGAVPVERRGRAPAVAPVDAIDDTFRVEGLTAMHTALVALPPAFVEALTKVAPKKRPSRVPLVIALGVAAVFVALGLDASTREFVDDRARHVAARIAPGHLPPREAVSTTSSAPAPAVVVPTVTRPPAVLVDDPTPPPPSVEPARKATKKPASKPTKKSESRPGAASPRGSVGLVAAQATRGPVGS